MNEPNLAGAHLVHSVGFLLLRSSAEIRRQWNRIYCGIDRLPCFPFPCESTNEQAGRASPSSGRLKDALEQWFDIRDTSSFVLEAQIAIRLLSVFRANGYSLELVFCELAWTPGEEDRASSYRPSERCLMPTVKYGYDVSWPGANHSAIFQPGVVPDNPSWTVCLNEWGLLSRYEDAAKLRKEYLAVYPYPPFDIFIVYGVAGQ